MSTKIDYPPEEWELLKRGPAYAGVFVMGAAPSGSGGMEKEVDAIAQAIVDAFKQVTPNTLLSALLGEMIGRLNQAQDEVKSRVLSIAQTNAKSEANLMQSLERVRDAVGLVAAKGTPEELAEYKRLIQTAAQNAASAARENTLLGMGGEQISSKEQAALDQLNAVLA